MAIVKLYNGKFQVKLRAVDGRWLTKVCDTKKQASLQEAHWKQEKNNGTLVSYSNQLTVNQFFDTWIEHLIHKSNSSGWRKEQVQQFKDYISPTIGSFFMNEVQTRHVHEVFVGMSREGLSNNTQRLVYATLSKLFKDAKNIYQLISHNPVTGIPKPETVLKEAQHLDLDEIRKLLDYVKGKKFGIAIWTQLFLGLRVSELQALKWEDFNFQSGTVVIKRAFVRKLNLIRDYPKGKKYHTIPLPPELAELLVPHQKESGFVISDSDWELVMPYKGYHSTLAKYCKELGIEVIATHGLRHTSSLLYLNGGASKEDLKDFFAHSNLKITERYLHSRGTKLSSIASKIKLF